MTLLAAMFLVVAVLVVIITVTLLNHEHFSKLLTMWTIVFTSCLIIGICASAAFVESARLHKWSYAIAWSTALIVSVAALALTGMFVKDSSLETSKPISKTTGGDRA